MDTTTIDRIDAELKRLRAARPALFRRIDRAESILTTQLFASNGSRPVKVRISPNGSRSYTVRSGSKLSRSYTVSGDFKTCSCPDHRNRGGGCKHSIVCYVIGRVLSA